MDDPDLNLVAGEAPRDPEQLEASAVQVTGELSASTRLGPVHLTVSALQRSIDYYIEAVGLELLETSSRTASLGVGQRELLVLVEEPGAKSASRFGRALGPLRERGDLSRRSGWARDRDLLGSSPRALGGPGRVAHDDGSARRRFTARRA